MIKIIIGSFYMKKKFIRQFLSQNNIRRTQYIEITLRNIMKEDKFNILKIYSKKDSHKEIRLQ